MEGEMRRKEEELDVVIAATTKEMNKKQGEIVELQ